MRYQRTLAIEGVAATSETAAVAGATAELGEPPYQVRLIARWLDAHPSTVYRLIESGALRARRIGLGRGGLRVPRSAWVKFLKDSEVPPPAGPAGAAGVGGGEPQLALLDPDAVREEAC